MNWLKCTFLLTLVCISGCGSSEKTAVNSAAQQERLVVLGGELSETIVALGLEDKIVAVDTTSLWPPRLQSLPSVGYMRQLNTEGILSLQPTKIIASHEAGPPEVLAQWRKLGLEVHQITTGPTIADAQSAIEQVGNLLGADQESAELVAEIDRALAELQLPEQAPRTLFMLSKAGNQALIAGRDTKAHTVISAAGGQNLATVFSGYKPMTPEAIVDLAPEIILIPSHSLSSFGGYEKLLADPAIRLTPAGKYRRVLVIESHVMLNLGPRLGKGVNELNGHFRTVHSGEETPSVAKVSQP